MEGSKEESENGRKEGRKEGRKKGRKEKVSVKDRRRVMGGMEGRLVGLQTGRQAVPDGCMDG